MPPDGNKNAPFLFTTISSETKIRTEITKKDTVQKKNEKAMRKSKININKIIWVTNLAFCFHIIEITQRQSKKKNILSTPY